MDATAIVERLNELGVKVSREGRRLRFEPAERIPLDLVEEIKANKQAIADVMGTRSSATLRRALTQKTQEIAVMRRRLASEYYADDGPYQTWGQDVIGCLTAHVDEIRRYLREGGALSLPPCCKDKDYLCLIAMRRFDGCLMTPAECGFSIAEETK